jgi:hypothetical protein
MISILLLLAGQLSAAEITIRVPTQPIKPGQFAMLAISGLTDADLQSSTATITPSAGVQFFPARLWGGEPYLFFQTAIPGKYEISIGINRWQGSLDAGLDGATRAKIDSGLLAELTTIVTRVGGKYQAKSGSAILVVGGTTTPVDPTPVDPTTKIDRATYFYEKDSHNVPKAVAFALQRLNREYEVVASEFEEDTVDGTGEVPDQYKISLAAARKAGLPCLVIQAGSRVVKVVTAPTTETQVMDAVLK